jgi:hypothetical protein
MTILLVNTPEDEIGLRAPDPCGSAGSVFCAAIGLSCLELRLSILVLLMEGVLILDEVLSFASA